MRDCVTVAVAARLHLGFLDLNGGLGRRFGSLGLALDEPETHVELSRSPRDEAEGPQAERACGYLAPLVKRQGIRGGHRLVIRHAIPAHAGLGSGTQLALAVAAALRRLYRLPFDVEADARFLDRSARSALGAAFFADGGVALDGGRGPANRAAPVIARLAFPEEWRILLVLDPSRQGIHGAEELAAFQTLPPMSADLAAHLCRLAIMQALPALVEHDLAGFGKAVTEIQKHVGDYFGPVQGGRYASPGVSAALDAVARAGVAGYGQSSWGPTGFALAGSGRDARTLIEALAPLAAARGLEMKVVKGRNSGAVITDRARAVGQGARHG
jgi:beta-RFAP synthase